MATAESPTRKRYPARCHEFARRLHQERGYTIPEVIEALAKRGIRPSRSTVIYWCDPDRREAHNLKQKRNRYPSLKRRPLHRSWWVKARRAEQLRAAGLSLPAVAAVLKLDFDLDLTAEQLRYAERNPSARRRTFGTSTPGCTRGVPKSERERGTK